MTYKEASWTPAGKPFRFDGSSRICPLCHVFLQQDRSTAVRLPKPIVPRTLDSGTRSADTGEFYYGDLGGDYVGKYNHEWSDVGRARSIPSPTRARWFAHERCWLRYQENPKPQADFEAEMWEELNKWLDREVFKCRRSKR